ncbi:unnamed protein product [Rotaria sordida]|uniref:Uncharacterized protein n=1 Tax=Rotaria sordida TaxID=392033 RepID=A0A815KJ94_9BILA|nr:unnamed protein product [Rotaria sordida]
MRLFFLHLDPHQASQSTASAASVPKSTTASYQPSLKPQPASKSESQEFAAPGTCEKLGCGGRPCAKCHKCRDWHFSGDQATWNWIRNWQNWDSKDWERWSRDRIYNLFSKRDGATCFRFSIFFRFSIGFHVCICELH